MKDHLPIHRPKAKQEGDPSGPSNQGALDNDEQVNDARYRAQEDPPARESASLDRGFRV